jgi:hypothetical protein
MVPSVFAPVEPVMVQSAAVAPLNVEVTVHGVVTAEKVLDPVMSSVLVVCVVLPVPADPLVTRKLLKV